MNLQNKIYTCRKKLGLSQEKLAEAIGVSRQAISKWETGEAIPEVTKVITLCNTFDVSADWLLNDAMEPEDLPVEMPVGETAPADAPENAIDEAAEIPTEEAGENPIDIDYEFAEDEPKEQVPEAGFKNLISFKIYKYFGRLGFVILGLAMYALMAYGVYFYHKCWYAHYGVKAIILACYGLCLSALGFAGIIASAVMLIASFVQSRKLSTQERVEIVENRHTRFKKYYLPIENKLGFIGAGVILFAASLTMSVGVMFSFNYVLSRSLVVMVGLALMVLATLMVLYSAILFYRVYHTRAVKKQDK